ncbi:MAG: hypothetical protein LBP30_04335 [Clostridiales Family XIII bacterium]|jgi:hypothetical protein|nr:hypothetical protein [Clostridiales Family XIII bacterium]
MRIYDKAEWQIDGGIDKSSVSEHFKLLFEWLNENGLLNDDGKEICELGSFSEVSLHSELLTDLGRSFIENHYDDVASKHRYDNSDFIDALAKMFIGNSDNNG